MGKRWMAAWMLAVVLAAQAQAKADTPAEAPPQVEVSTGMLRGSVAEGVAAFKGIPYAAPPISGLRWRAPQPPTAWTGVRDATAFGSTCMQFVEPAIVPPGVGQSEDCLTLNVWAPAVRPRAPLPVMVWIHGGGLVQGTGAGLFYSGDRLVRRGVVVITLNYRLGRLGFFAHPALSAEDPTGPLGSYGLMDQIAALRWVKTNIAAFGGDPARVTIFGESSGGDSVLHLLAAPAARGLFHRAVSQSAFPRQWWKVALRRAAKPGSPAAEVEGEAIAKSLGVSGGDASAAAALRALPVARLKQGHPPGAPLFVDGVLIPRPVFEMFAAGQQARVPLMIGGNSWESNSFDFKRVTAEGVFERTGDRKRALQLFDPKGALGLQRAAYDLLSDQDVNEPARRLAELHSAHGARAFLYRFSYVTAARRGQQPGAPHAGELAYVFGTLPKQPFQTLAMGVVPAANAEDWAMSDKLMAYWTEFARAGDPGAAGGQRWPAYTRGERPLLDFAVGGPRVRQHFNAERLDWLQSIAARAN